MARGEVWEVGGIARSGTADNGYGPITLGLRDGSDPKLVLPTDTKERLNYPMWDGLLAYFPNALAEVARNSHIGNQQHNPGERLHWAREKSRDHKNKIVKHLLDAGPIDAPVLDTDGVLHSVKAAWRALALAEEQLNTLGRPYGENAKPLPKGDSK